MTQTVVFDTNVLFSATGWRGRPYVEQALAILEAKLGLDHPTTKIIRNNLQSL